eukprot:6180775-Pleurochrysis_carterae.AAC.2
MCAPQSSAGTSPAHNAASAAAPWMRARAAARQHGRELDVAAATARSASGIQLMPSSPAQRRGAPMQNT